LSEHPVFKSAPGFRLVKCGNSGNEKTEGEGEEGGKGSNLKIGGKRGSYGKLWKNTLL
jgi:hypothetical protein